jgi:non-heme chloroperoxidase
VEETRRQRERVAGHGIDDVVGHYAEIVRALEPKPIVIGHSFGGLIVQRLLGEGLAAAAVAIDPAPIKGVVYLPPSALRVASVALRNPANRKRAVALTAGQFRYGFGNAVTAEESDELYERWAIPRREGRCSRQRPPISRAGRRRGSTPRTRREARC